MKFSLKEFFIHEGGNYKSSAGGGDGAKSSHAHGGDGKKSSTNIQVNIGEAGRRSHDDDSIYADYKRDLDRDDRLTGHRTQDDIHVAPDRYPDQMPGGSMGQAGEQMAPVFEPQSGDMECPYCGNPAQDGYCPRCKEVIDPSLHAANPRHSEDMDEAKHDPTCEGCDECRKNEAQRFQFSARYFTLLEKKLSSYEHPRTHLAKKFAKRQDVENPWALAQHIASKEGVTEHQDPTQRKDIGATAWSSPSQEIDVKKFESEDGILKIDLQELKDFFSEGGPGSGRKKGSKNKPKGQPKITPGAQVDTSSLPSSDDDIDALMASFGDEPEPKALDTSPFKRELGDEEGFEPDELSFLDDPEFGKGSEAPAYEPRKKVAKPSAAPPEIEKPKPEQFPDFPDWDEMIEQDKVYDFRDVQDEKPEAADAISSEIGDAAKKSGFVFKGAEHGRFKFIFMKTPDGQRWKHSDAAGWLPYDDGQSPTGEF